MLDYLVKHEIALRRDMRTRNTGRSMLRSALAATVVVLAAAGGLLSCAYPSSGPYPFSICGRTFPDSSSLVYDASDKAVTVDYDPSEGYLPFVVAPGCAHGIHVSWIPRSAARLVGAVYAPDGLALAVELAPTGRSAFRLVAAKNGRLVVLATVKPE